ncbi:MAG: 50S ribosomal protein L31e [Candidatus Woesearchaeota archaeon]|nr:50S ribosomal protein L31e [Candidatus Woesearchaeota archaeon]
MAEEKTIVKDERVYVIPLRRRWLKVVKYQRGKKAVKAVREFIIKHMKSNDVKIGKYLNETLWERGIRKPPHKVKVRTWKEDDVVKVELIDAPIEEKKMEVKEDKKKVEEKKVEKDKGEEIKETLEEEKKEVLQKGITKKERKVSRTKEKFADKEKSIMTKEEKIIGKTQKPHHEKKK